MAKRQAVWVRVKAMSAEEKASVAETCRHFIMDTLKPWFLPEIRPTKFNYPVDLLGKWRGNKYSFVTRYRSGHPENIGEEFDSPFTRLDHVEECVSETRFDVMWRRHTGHWLLLHRSVPLEEALGLIQSEELLWPL